MLFQREARIIQNKKLRADFYACILSAPEIARRAEPGQFINVKVASGASLLLRRPFSINSVLGDKIKIIYQVLGEGTKLLSEKKRGGYLDIIGPLGSGFEYKLRQPFLLVAGGMGVAPLTFLAQSAANIGNKKSNAEGTVLIGAKTASQLLCEKEFRKLGFDVKIATDDGSRGFKGRVTELLKGVLSLGCRYTALYSCGPHPMLKEVAFIAKRHKIPAEVSLEEHMACGIGACLGCVVATRFGLKRVCKEGPVFKAQDVIW
ncbi:MAG TPA: dihydroorotate dehydrogenase electron transfer subunit [Candidatus Margulisiibacteriota bacterium]|nr:dihydroorotate dehydrogenase electron transfer subunit [Candidatus Margulisiibacteriota bacterium]